MKINVLTIVSGPTVNLQPGVQEVEDTLAQSLLDSGYAKPIEAEQAEPEEEPEEIADPDYPNTSKKVLIKMCRDRTLDIPSGAGKDEIIELLELDDQTK
ncbi:MAG: hypothetical protein ABUJ92_00390 [Desulfobacterales bacterium]